MVELEVYEAQDDTEHDVHGGTQAKHAHVAHHVQEAAVGEVRRLNDPRRRVQPSVVEGARVRLQLGEHGRVGGGGGRSVEGGLQDRYLCVHISGPLRQGKPCGCVSQEGDLQNVAELWEPRDFNN